MSTPSYMPMDYEGDLCDWKPKLLDEGSYHIETSSLICAAINGLVPSW